MKTMTLKQALDAITIPRDAGVIQSMLAEERQEMLARSVLATEDTTIVEAEEKLKETRMNAARGRGLDHDIYEGEAAYWQCVSRILMAAELVGAKDKLPFVEGPGVMGNDYMTMIHNMGAYGLAILSAAQRVKVENQTKCKQGDRVLIPTHAREGAREVWGTVIGIRIDDIIGTLSYVVRCDGNNQMVVRAPEEILEIKGVAEPTGRRYRSVEELMKGEDVSGEVREQLTFTDKQLKDAVGRVLSDFTMLEWRMTRADMWILVCAVQLALRHPHAENSPSLKRAGEIIKTAEDALAGDDAALREMVRRGRLAEYDEAPDKPARKQKRKHKKGKRQ